MSEKIFKSMFGVSTGNGSSANQNLWETITSDFGSAIANTTTDTLSILGITGVATSILGDILTVDASDSVVTMQIVEDDTFPIDYLKITQNSVQTNVTELIKGNGLMFGGGVVWTGTGLNFTVGAAAYYINGDLYTSTEDTITLSVADGSLDRIDIIVVDITNTVVVVEGIPAAFPIKPQALPETQVELTSILIPASATEPGGIIDEQIYDENVEWITTQTGGATVDEEDVTNPKLNLKAMEVTTVSNNDTLLFTTADKDLTLYDIFSCHIDLKAVMAKKHNIAVSFWNSNSQVSDEIKLSIDKSITGTYQLLTIDITDFNVIDLIDQCRIRWIKTGAGTSHTGFFIDDIKLEAGITPPPINTEQNIWYSIITPSGTYPMPDSPTDSLIFAVDSSFTITGDASEDTVTFAVATDGINDTHIDWGTGANQVAATDIPMAVISGSTYSSVQHMQNIFHSAGWISGGIITDDADGTITVATGTGLIRATDSAIAEILFIDWSSEAGANVNLVDNDINWIYIEYNTGNPQVIATTTERTDFNTNILLASIQRTGTTLHVNSATKHVVGDHSNSMIRRMKGTMPYAHVSGAIISETGTRNIAATAGDFWHGLTEFSTNAFDHSSSGSFIYWYRMVPDSGWNSVSSQTQIDNTQYDDNSGSLATLSNNKYGVHWVYLEVDNDVDIVYGQGNYTLSQAEDAQPPAGLPERIQVHGFLIGKIIIKKSASAYTQIESAFQTTFTGSLAQSHSNLADLAGDDHTHYRAFNTILSDSGDTTADANPDTLTVSGGTGISTAISGDILTITNDAPNVNQTLDEVYNESSSDNKVINVDDGPFTLVTSDKVAQFINSDITGVTGTVTLKDKFQWDEDVTAVDDTTLITYVSTDANISADFSAASFGTIGDFDHKWLDLDYIVIGGDSGSVITYDITVFDVDIDDLQGTSAPGISSSKFINFKHNTSTVFSVDVTGTVISNNITMAGTSLVPLINGSDTDDKHTHNHCYVRMYVTTTNIAAFNVWTKVDLDNTTHIDNGTFSAANSRYTIDESGLYHLDTSVYINIPGPNTIYVDLNYYVNGVAITAGTRSYGFGNYANIHHSDYAKLSSGDYVELWARTNRSSTIPILGSAYNSRFNVVLISKD